MNSGEAKGQTYTVDGYGYRDYTRSVRSLRQVDILNQGKIDDGCPETIKFELTNLDDRPYTLIADVKNRFSYVPLHVEKPGPQPLVYHIVENFCPLTLEQTGKTGIGIVEVDWLERLQR